MTDAPAPDMAISELAVSFAIGNYHNTQDPCQLPVVTGSDASLFSEWASSWTTWQSEHIPEYKKIWTACSKESLVEDIVPVGTNVCSKIVAAITQDDDKEKTETTSKSTQGDKSEATSAQNSATSTGTGAQSEATTTEEDSPGSRQTGSLGIVGVVAGVVVAGLF
ncbi:hypothetical protein CEP51_004682 [Fusarium floridanum]|uniref:Infection structure specific protein n=1 Tax=Fusarium floridanum TaxID=1325733 RepID=A0A428S0D3_9HYPO|nr:hypothetical protein CEP51_004682 [Fusarium floridanum]